MKTIRCLLVFSACMLNFCQVNSQLIPPVRYLEVLHASGPMVMDGLANEAGYSDLQSTDIFNPTGWDGTDDDFNASFKITWDNLYLYICASITDDIRESYKGSYTNPWTFDNFEIFLQLDTCTIPSGFNSRTIQLRICRSLDSVEMAGRATRSAYRYYMEDLDTGWICEVAIPWTCVLESGEGPELSSNYRNTMIGFEFQGSDSDNPDGDPTIGNRDVQTAWDDDEPGYVDEETAWNNTAIFGRITLSTALATTDLQQSKYILFPNPASSAIHLRDIEPGSSLVIFNISGTKVMELNQINAQTPINVTALKSGLYTAIINGRESVRFVKE
jgi:hypothetical protein